ncbi:ferritin-like domain-containing protein [Georgenia subflava]|uniref:Ferritin-like domain-containing protein n=1 Tax=Georgenia subflava TaxID=1622177 RepID=A0A6N7EUI0_9MICO|nr:ferritin-like domain-containing protein [Georgenia subflava]MPV38804.1 ferritin-like domain-containing protein [Georgenia subflava]
MAFDIDRFARDSEGVTWDDLDLDVFRDDPLPPRTLRTLRYMCDVEYHTVCYLRDMLVTPSRADPEVGTFMTMWNREEFWHGEALAHVLELHGITVTYDDLKARRVKLGWRDRIAPVRQSVLSNIVGKDFVAVHMLWGAVNEWSASAAYKRLGVLEPHPALGGLLRRIVAQEARHVAFYTTQARARLADNPKAQRLARLALRTAWQPVGSGISSESEVTHVMNHLFSGREGRKEIDAIDRHIARLPGMSGLRVVADAMDARGVAA